MKTIFFSIIILFFSSLSFSQTIWQQSNGPNTGSLIKQLSVNQSGHIFAVSYAAGIFKSTDNGNSWFPVNQGLPQLNFEGDRVIGIAGNGDIYSSADNLGIYKSTSGGNSWFQTGFTQGIVNCICSAGNGDIYAGTPTGSGLFRSTNGGTNWVHLENGLPVYFTVSSISIAPAGTVFLCLSTGSDTSVYVSSDNGNNWHGTNLTQFSVNASAVNSSSHIFAAGGYSGNYTIYRSTNNGVSWVQKGNGLPQCRFNSMYFSTASGLFVCSDSGLYKSVNNGDNWVRINSEKYVYSFVNKQSGEYFMSALRTGVFKSSNSGTSWQSANYGLFSSVCPMVSISGSGNIYTGCMFGGVYRSTNDGSSWSKIWDANNNANVYPVFQTSNGYIFAGTDSGLFRSTDNGASWAIKSYVHNINGYFVSSNGYIFLGVGSFFYGIYRSTDNGGTFQNVWYGGSVYSFAVNSIGTIFAGTSDGIIRSTNNGSSWLEFGNLNEEVFSFVIVSNNIMFAGTRHNGLYKSTDFGNTWNNIWDQFDEITDLKYNQAGYLFAAVTYGGVYRSTNLGLNWTSFNTGLFNPFVFSIALNSNGYMFAGTYGAGVYKTINSTIGIKTISGEIPKDYSLYQNYPNPFNPVTKIKFDIPPDSRLRGNENVILKIFDARGSEIAVLVNELLYPGSYEIEWNGSNYSSGIYFYRIETGKYTETRKMVLVK